jgi:hypothetical protein
MGVNFARKVVLFVDVATIRTQFQRPFLTDYRAVAFPIVIIFP